MKRKIYIIIMLGAVLLGSSCEKYLNEKPSTVLSEGPVYGTQSGLEASIIGCYATMRHGYLWQGNLFEVMGCASGLIHWKGATRLTDISYRQGLDLTFYANDGNNLNAYNTSYSIINKANNLIEGLKDSPVESSFKTEIEAEAKLVRAIMYFLVVRMWGDVPIVLKAPKNLKDANTPRSSYKEVYKLILDDLTFAAEYMRDQPRQSAVTGTTGRPNKWAATAFKAKVYVQLASLLSYAETPENNPYSSMPDFTNCGIVDAKDAWTKAQALCESIINNGPYSLAPSYGQLFRWGYDQNAPRQYNPAYAAQDYQLSERIFVLNLTENGTASGSYTTRSLPDSPKGLSKNWGRVRPSRYVFQKFAATYGGKKSTDPKLPNLYIDCADPRFDLTFYHTQYYQRATMDAPFGATSGAGITKQTIYPTANRVVVTPISDAPYAPYFRKYDEPRYAGARGYADFYMLRFADIYLMAAEASAELSSATGDVNWNKAMGYIEVLHSRARKSTDTGIEASMPKWESNRFTTKQELTDAIFWERIFELYGEGHEWFDVRRKGCEFIARNLTEPMNKFLKEPEQQYVYIHLYGNHTYATTATELRKSLLCAFPLGEMQVNSGIDESKDQNRFIVQ